MRIRFLQYNIAGCRNYETSNVSANENRTLQAIKSFDADIITLNELDYIVQRSNKVAQPSFLAESLGMNYYFAPTIEFDGGLYGIALLSKYEIISAKTIKIPDSYNNKGELYERRAIISAILKVEDRQLRVVMSHYGLSETEQINAVECTIKELTATEMPTVFSGDLNMTPDNSLIKKISEYANDTAFLFDKTPHTFPSSNLIETPKMKIDYVFTRGDIRADHAEVRDIKVSDHLPYYCELVF